MKKSPDILEVVSKHLFGQFRCLVFPDNCEILERWKVSKHHHRADRTTLPPSLSQMDSSYTLERREDLLGEFLKFLSTLSATHVAIRSVLASDQWFRTLLKIVDVNPTTGNKT